MDELIPLSSATLDKLPKGVSAPSYDRASLTPGIIHVGLGNFHRAHQAWYLHKLMQMGLAHDWAIIGAGVRPADAQMRERLVAQDCLTTLVELDPAGRSAEVVGSMIDFLPVEEGNATLIERMASPDIRIVAMTVTEGGYYVRGDGEGLDTGHLDIVHDGKNPSRPRTVFGAMVEALRRRKADGAGPFTGLSCDNLQANGTILRRCVVDLARLSDSDLADWIDTHCTFPNSMVDCIVPATGPRELEIVKSIGVDDRAPVTHENFRQWVIEDDFCAGRPDWDEAGATFAESVHAYEAMKLRILNGGHQLIAIPADLLGIDTISGAMAAPAIRAFLHQTVEREIAPNVVAVPGMTPLAYLDLIDRRFSNAEIIDTTRRVAFDGSSRQTGFIIPSIRDALANGQPVDGLALMSALWMRYCMGRREDGSDIAANDPNWAALHAVAKNAATDPMIWLAQTNYYGDLAGNVRFSAAFRGWAELLAKGSVNHALGVFADEAAMAAAR